MTHLVKMTEPLCTAALAVCLGQARPTLSLALVLVASVVSAMGSEPGTLGPASLAGVLLALASNLAYAARNTGIKYVCKGKIGIQDFSVLSLGG